MWWQERSDIAMPNRKRSQIPGPSQDEMRIGGIEPEEEPTYRDPGYLGTDEEEEVEVRDLGHIIEDRDDRRITVLGDWERRDEIDGDEAIENHGDESEAALETDTDAVLRPREFVSNDNLADRAAREMEAPPKRSKRRRRSTR
jgi:hypothetical protein